MFGSAAKKENVQLKQQIVEMQQFIAGLQQQVAGLQYEVSSRAQFLESIGGGDVALLNQKREEFKAEIAQLETTKGALQAEIEKLKAERKEAEKSLIEVRDEIKLQENGLYYFENPAEDSIRYEVQLSEVRQAAKQMVKDKTAVLVSQNFTFNDSKAKGKSFTNNLSKLALRSYNAEVENAITKLKAGNLKTGINRLERAFTEAGRLGQLMELRINPKYHHLRLEELRLAAQHLEAKKAAKEAEKEERARLREERKAQAEMEAERKRLLKEKAHYEKALAALMASGRTDEASELEGQLEEINKGIEDVDYRAANIRAGYVYVISNVGSFGENMVKIGLTRRINPEDRVRELGDASVPFNFDTHVIHFSDDAVGVEAELHRHFADRKVNLINTRREFFYATPAEVKEALKEIEGNVLEYRDEADAEQYRASIALRKEANV
ncbi:DUF4041 domain-containing protein [Corynebacterium sp. LK33]|uniref:DUF4041 domain-containing protein n=1 Tax=Corynebacterium sp. LK33 TaxID=2044574 RepID=UPI001651F6B4|nr:DUF4041 domain-containing protein [Corynebacterium sp. LK33]MBC6822337.1 hypothetical protein [Corynebacterium sp. LK33]